PYDQLLPGQRDLGPLLLHVERQLVVARRLEAPEHHVSVSGSLDRVVTHRPEFVHRVDGSGHRSIVGRRASAEEIDLVGQADPHERASLAALAIDERRRQHAARRELARPTRGLTRDRDELLGHLEAYTTTSPREVDLAVIAAVAVLAEQ